MRKYLPLLLVLLVVMMLLPAALASAQAPAEEKYVENRDIQVFINGEEVFFDVAPQFYRGNLMVPLRTLFENLGATVKCNEENDTITIKKGNNQIIFYPQISYVEINDNEEKFYAGTSSVVVKGVTMVPLRFFLEFWGFRVKWNEDLRVVEVESSDFIPFERVSAKNMLTLSSSVFNWVDNARNTLSLQAKREKEKLFVLGAYGKKPSGGYEVEIKQILKGPESLKVKVEFREPLPGQLAIQVISRPYELVCIDLGGRIELQETTIKWIETEVRGLKRESLPVFLELNGGAEEAKEIYTGLL
jgi:hypothetical protein